MEYYGKIIDSIQKNNLLEECYTAMGSYYLADYKYDLAIAAFTKLTDPSKVVDAKFKAVVSINKRDSYVAFMNENPKYKPDEIKARLKSIEVLIAKINDCQIAAEKKFASGDKEGAYRLIADAMPSLEKDVVDFPDAIASLGGLRKIQDKYYTFTAAYEKEIKETAASRQINGRIYEMVSLIDRFTSRATLIKVFGQPASSNLVQMYWNLQNGNELRVVFNGARVQAVFLNGAPILSF